MSQRARSIAQSLLLISATAVVVGFLPSLAGSAEGATGVPWVKSLVGASPIIIGQGQSNVQVASMSLPAAKYLVQAKLTAVPNPLSQPTNVSCKLMMGSVQDLAAGKLSSDSVDTWSLMLTGKLNSPGTAVLTCSVASSGGGESVSIANIRITAMKVGTLTTV